MSASEQARERSRYLSLLQIAAVLGVVAYHVGTPYYQAVWIVLDLFLVMAGMNMARTLDRDQSIHSYALSRIRRFGPEILAVWCATVVFALSGQETSGMLWFISTSPVFLQNLTLAFFHYTMPNDWVFGPLWFVAALLQLQLLLFVMRRVLLRLRPEHLVIGCVGVATICRLLFAALSGNDLDRLSEHTANVLYCLPFTHLEAVVLGLLMGRGALPRIGRRLPLFCVVALALGALNVALSQGEVSLRSLGFPLFLRQNYAYVWGYPIMAVIAAALCSRRGRLAVAVEALTLPGWADRTLSKLASLTYGTYAFHGVVMATGINAAEFLVEPHARGLRLLLFAITVVESFLIAWGFDLMLRALKEYRVRWIPGGVPPILRSQR